MKKVIISICMVLLLSCFITGCGNSAAGADNNGASSGNDSGSSRTSGGQENTPSFTISQTDITIDADEIELSVGTWKYEESDTYWNMFERGTFEISLNEQNEKVLTYKTVTAWTNAYKMEYDETKISQKNSVNALGMYEVSKLTDTRISLLKRNSNSTKFKYISTQEMGGETNTSTVLLQKQN